MLETQAAVRPKGLCLAWKLASKSYFCWGLKNSHCAMRFQHLRTTSIAVVVVRWRNPIAVEVVLSCWNAGDHGNKLRKNGVRIPESCPKPAKHTRLRRETRGTAVSKLHGRAPNPRARQRGGARARGGWRRPVCGEHFYDFWLFFRSFSGKLNV